MAMTMKGGGDKKLLTPMMNVTPLVDVVLVLLIIFIVITPQLTKKFWVHVPKQEKQEIDKKDVKEDPSPPLVLRVGGDKVITVNGVDVTFTELPERLRRMFAARDDHILFFDAADDAEYGFAVEVMDQARAGGAVTIAALMAQLENGPQPATSAPPQAN
jgi:biopolymer transport protein ExbD/biopolymer transport protein TolR